MATFIITGNSDEASAKLKATLEASNTSFNANLEALFKSPSPRTPAPAPVPTAAAAAAAAAAPAAGPHASAGWTLGTNRNRSSDSDNSGSLRGRLRTSLRVTPSR